jgi:SAM-dependent methyltransferase
MPHARSNAHNALVHLHNYWQKRSANYDSPIPDVFGRRIIAAYLKKLKPKSLVEVGCGNGQLFSAYKDIPRVVGCDWTDGMLEKARQRKRRHGYNNITLKKLDITKEALPERFEVALTRTVLMHIPKENVEDACVNLTRMADTLMLMEFYDPNANNLDWHNFHHEYPFILDKLGYHAKELFDRPDGIRQLLMIFKKEENVKNGK